MSRTLSEPFPGTSHACRINPAMDPAWHLAALMGIAVALGGGGVGAGAANMMVQLVAILVMAINRHAFALFFHRRAQPLTVLVGLSVLLPLVQLIPLPPALWQGLPGRDMVTASFGLIGEDGWYPLTLDRGRTLTAFLGTLPPLTVIVVGSVLPLERLRWLARAVIIMGIAAMLCGAVQVAGGRSGTDRMSATFADWNGAAVFFGGCLLLVIALYPDASRRHEADGSPLTKILLAAAGCLLLTGTLLTQSRTGIVLLAIPLGLVIMRFVYSLMRRNRDGVTRSAGSPAMIAIAIAAGALLAAGATAIVLSGGGRLDEVTTRFDTGDNGKRIEMREDALSAARHYWPVGAGMGAFDEVFQVDESLEYLSARKAGRAHMDYYELAIEAGIAGLLLAAAWLAWVLVATKKAVHGANWIGLAGAGFIACCAAQSLLSFPLRNQTMLTMAGLAVVLLRTTTPSRETRR